MTTPRTPSMTRFRDECTHIHIVPNTPTKSNLDLKVHIPRIHIEATSWRVSQMKITAQEEYGMRCLLRLAKTESGSITLPEVAAAEGLSLAYVGKPMAGLRHAGPLGSVRGRSGGYRLPKPP